MKLTIKDNVYIALLTAIVVVATSIHIPLPTGGMVHLGSATTFTIAILFGGIYSGIASAIGSAIFDLLYGHVQYTVFSIFIKGIAGFVVGYLTCGLLPRKYNLNYKKIFLVLLLGAFINAFGYFLAWSFVLGSTEIALMKVPSSLITSSVAITITLILVPLLQKLIFRK